MQLKDVLDMHDYLTDRCYCPGEIYDQISIPLDKYHPQSLKRASMEQ